MPSIIDFTGERFERLMSWARYLHWADLHRSNFDAWIKADHDIADDCQGWEFIALMSAWYASLWVVLEGWNEVPLSDPSVDELLSVAPRYKELLRRYRNGVFHYQPRLAARRLFDFLDEGEETVYWTHLLHEEFCRFYWELVERSPIHEKLRSDLRQSVIKMVGWIPNDIPEAHVESVREQARRAVSILREAGDFSSPAARDVLEAARHGANVAIETEQRVREWKAEMLTRIRREGRSAKPGKPYTSQPG